MQIYRNYEWDTWLLASGEGINFPKQRAGLRAVCEDNTKEGPATDFGRMEGDAIMKASRIAFISAPLIALFGMGWGIFMAISEDHSTSPAHAHLNLLGWVSLFLLGVYYRFHPDTDVSKLARFQVSVWAVMSLVIAVGIALIYLGAPLGEPIAAVASIVLFADMALFVWLILRSAH